MGLLQAGPWDSERSVWPVVLDDGLFADSPPAGHCAQGMTYAINPPSTGPNTFAAFKARAKASFNATGTANSTTPTNSSTTGPRTIEVTVGDGGSLTFLPDQVTAKKGDSIFFVS